MHRLQPRLHLPKASVRKGLLLSEKWDVHHIGAHLCIPRRRRNTMQKAASDGNEPLKPCGQTSINVCIKAPSLVITVNSLSYLHPTIPIPPAKRLAPPHGFLSQWVFAVLPPHHAVFFILTGFLCRLVFPQFFPGFFSALKRRPRGAQV